MKLRKWYYINKQYYPTLVSEEELKKFKGFIKEWTVKDDIERMPTKEEMSAWDYYESRDIVEFPKIFAVYLAKDVDKLLENHSKLGDRDD